MKPSEVRAATYRLNPPSEEVTENLSPAASRRLYETWVRVRDLQSHLMDQGTSEPATLDALEHLGRCWQAAIDAVVEPAERDP